MDAVEDVDDGAGVVDDRGEVGAGALLARREPEHGILEPGRDQVILERALVLEVVLGLCRA